MIMGFIVLVIMLRIYVGLQEAVSNPIDKGVPFYKARLISPVADYFYRIVRIVGCILVAFMFQGGLLYGISCYIFAWLFKKGALYYAYKD